MKKILFIALMFVLGTTAIFAQAKAEITFDKTTHDFGTFSEKDPKVSCVFTFKNTGKASLIIHQAVASCGCTVPSYTKEPIKPGETGEIKITYNGAGRFPGHFKKTITIHSNAKNEMVRVYIEGDMTAKDAKTSKEEKQSKKKED